MAAPTPPPVAERVTAGAAWLDEHEPGWVDRIDLDKLALSDGCYCILGQLGDDYDEYRSAHGLSAPEARDLGFTEFGGGFDRLTYAWRELIQARHAAPVEQPEPSPGERLVASITESYERHRAEQALTRIAEVSIEGGQTDRDRLRAVWRVLADAGYPPPRGLS